VSKDGDDLVYKMDRWKIEGIFLKMSDLVTLSAPQMDGAEVTQMAVEAHDRTNTFAKKESAWEPVLTPFARN